MNQIRDALAAGKEVITHTDDISVPGWSGAGYVIYDPGVGDGAWKIGGGMNGSFFSALQFGLSVLVAFLAIYPLVLFVAAATGIFGVATLITLSGLALIVESHTILTDPNLKNLANNLGDALIGFGLPTALFGTSMAAAVSGIVLSLLAFVS